MIKEIFIQANVEFQRPNRNFDMDIVLGTYYEVPKQGQHYPEKVLLPKYSFITLEKVQQFYDENEAKRLGKGVVKNFELIYVKKKGKWVQGEYYAHEYDQYANGRGRKIEWSNGKVEYEVQCLDKSLKVLDGVWEESSGNGCGDYFEPMERGLD